MTLKSTDKDAINAAFAERVAGWKPSGFGGWVAPGTHHDTKARFTDSADAVMPWLNKCGMPWSYDTHPSPSAKAPRLMLFTPNPNHANISAEGDFPLAACIALIRASGVKVED